MMNTRPDEIGGEGLAVRAVSRRAHRSYPPCPQIMVFLARDGLAKALGYKPLTNP